MTARNHTIKNIFSEHQGKVSDKWSLYISEYDRLFLEYREQPIRLLEIGIQNGGSLEIWNKYFKHAEIIVGCDINQTCAQLKFEEQNIALVIGDANAEHIYEKVIAHSSKFNIIIDDGSHTSSDIVRSFAQYFPHLNDGGLFIVEDLHCSYWQEYEGGLHQPYSSIAFFKSLADTINHEHWGTDKTRAEHLRSFNRKYRSHIDELTLTRIHSVEFLNSMCIVRKASHTDNVLGLRCFAGKTSIFDENPLRLHGSNCPRKDQSANPWSDRDVPAEAELPKRILEIASLNHDINERDKEIFDLKTSAINKEKIYFQDLLKLQQQFEARSLEQIQLEKSNIQFQHDLQQAATQHKDEITLQLSKLEALHCEQLEKIHQQLQTHLSKSTELEQSFLQTNAQLTKNHHEQLSQLVAREHELSSQLEANWIKSTEQVQLLSQNNLQLIQTHNEQILQLTINENALKAQLDNKQLEISDLSNHIATLGASQALALEKIETELTEMRSTYSWRWTSPLRSLRILSAKK